MDFNELFNSVYPGFPEQTEADRLKKLAESILGMSKQLGEVKDNLGKINDSNQNNNQESR